MIDMSDTLIAIYWTSIVANLVLGTIILKRDVRSPIHVSIFLFTLFQAAWVYSLLMGYSHLDPYNEALSTTYIKLAYGFGAFMYVALAVFFYFFPRKAFTFPRWISLTFIGSALAMFCISSFTNLVHNKQIVTDGAYVGDTFGPLLWWYIGYLVVLLIIPLIIAWQKISTLRGIQLWSGYIAAISGSIFVGLIILSNVILPIFGDMQIGEFHTKYITRVSPLYSLLFLIPTFYAIHQYRLFHVSNAVLKYIHIILVGSGAVISMTIVHTGLHYLLPAWDDDILLIPVMLTGVGVMYAAQHFIPELTTKNIRDVRNALQQLTANIYNATTYEELRTHIENTFIIRLNVTSARIYFIDQKTYPEIPTYYNKTLLHALKHSDNTCIRTSDAHNTAVQKELQALDADVCIGLVHGGELMGMLTLSTHANNVPLTTDEIDSIIKVRTHMSIALINVLLAQKLQSKISNLEDLVQKKTKRLESQNKKIRTLVQRQTAFINRSSHDLRAPFSQALYAVRRLRQDTKGATGTEHVRHAIGMLESVHQLIDSIFNAQILELGHTKPQYETLKLGVLMRSMTAQFGTMVKQQGHTLELHTDHPDNTELVTDQSLLTQLVQNFVQNACKFSPAGATVRIEVAVDGNTMTISVIDHGAGVADSEKKKIFQKFHRGAGKTTHKGMGLGLYTCKSIAAIHGGKAWVTDTPGGGATFSATFVMPDAEKHAAQKKKRAART